MLLLLLSTSPVLFLLNLQLLSLESQALLFLSGSFCYFLPLSLFIAFLLPSNHVFHALYPLCVFIGSFLLLQLELNLLLLLCSLLSHHDFHELLILFSHFHDFSEGLSHLLIVRSHCISHQLLVVDSLHMCCFLRHNIGLYPGFDLRMLCALPSYSILALEQEDAILRNLGHPEAVMYDALLIPIKRVVHIKIVFFITVCENKSHVLWFEVTNSFHAHLQDNIIAILRPIASLEKQNGQCEWLGTCACRVVEPIDPVFRVNSHVVETWGVDQL